MIVCSLSILQGCASRISDNQGGLQLPDQDYRADSNNGSKEYLKYCQSCHGSNAKGTSLGPPLVSRIYRPDHHSDMSFYKAAQMGTYQHHWHFGNMPPVKGITPEQIANIIAYIRGLQRAAGIK